MQPEDLLAVAHLVRPHGLRGEVSTEILTPAILDPLELVVGRRLYLRPPGGEPREAKCEAARPHQARWLLKIEGYDSIDDAETLRGHDLCLPRHELPELPEGWYYESDLEGCRVEVEGAGMIGTVATLETTGAQPRLRVRREGGGPIDIPWVKAYVLEINLPAKLIRLSLPAGFPGVFDTPPDEA